MIYDSQPQTKYSARRRSYFYFPYERNTDGVDSLIGHHDMYSAYNKHRIELLNTWVRLLCNAYLLSSVEV